LSLRDESLLMRLDFSEPPHLAGPVGRRSVLGAIAVAMLAGPGLALAAGTTLLNVSYDAATPTWQPGARR
jgi:hypothetical protein